VKQSKVLILDIETSPLLVYVWGLRKQFLRSDQIKKDWYIMAWCAKWLGGTKPIYYDTQISMTDKPILEVLWKMLDEAEIVITQNGKNFDAKKINARFILAGMKPPSSYKHFDTYQLAKSVAGFTSNSLDYLTHKLCKQHQKKSHKKFPGIKLWIECLKGNKEAWHEMKKYNIKDVLATEELYLKIRAWAPESFPKVYNLTNKISECGTCGYEGHMREGKPRKAKKYLYKQNSCPKCGAWQTGGRIT
jgi:hypothetical protein